ncbi:hypothetical protein Tco_0322273 [Tanacetum coccineum]
MSLWEGLHYSLHHPTSSIPYPRFTKIIISHYMTNFPVILRRAPDLYHNLKDDDIMKNIFNSGRYKDKVGMKIPAWMISEEIKHTEHYQMYVEVFGIYVPLTQSQPTEFTQGTHRTPSAPRSPDPNMDAGVLSAPKRSTVIRFCIPQRRSTRLTPPALVPTVDKADEMILQDTLHISLAKHKSQEEQEARENVELVNEHLESLEIEKMVEGPENVIDDSSIPRNDDQNIPSTRLEPRSDKESPEVEITNDEEVEITNVVIFVNVNKEEEEITEVYELKRREKRKIVKESRSTPFPTPIRSPRIHTDLFLSGVTGPRDQDDPHDDAHPEGENSAKQQKTYEYEVHVTGESSGQVNEKEQDDDEVPTKQVSQDIMEEVSLAINEAELKKIADEMLRQRCTSGDVCE